MTHEQKLEQFAERELVRHINNIIVPQGSHEYVAFGRYYIITRNCGVTVCSWDREIHRFENQRHALSWCIADRHQKLNLAHQILNLDAKHQQLSNDIYCRRAQARRSKSYQFYENVEAKIQPKLSQLKAVATELEKCIKTAKYLQAKGFTNETARTIGSAAK